MISALQQPIDQLLVPLAGFVGQVRSDLVDAGRAAGKIEIDPPQQFFVIGRRCRFHLLRLPQLLQDRIDLQHDFAGEAAA